MRIFLHLFLSLCLLISTISCDSGGSSDSSNEAPISLRDVTVSPTAARPGNPVHLQNFPSLPSGYEWTIALGDNIVPLMKNETEGFFAPAPLIFKDGSNWPDTPAQPLDLVLYRNGVEEDRLPGVLTLEPLLRADGSSDAIEQNLLNIVTQLAVIGDAFASIPGEYQQYMSMIIDTFNQMLTGDCDSCLKTQLDLLAQEGGLELLDALLAEGGLVEYFSNLETFLTQNADGLATIQVSSSSSSTLIQPAFTMPEQTDVMLAYQMQFYEVAKLFGQEVINATGTGFGNTLGRLIGALGVIGVTNPVATTTATVTGAVLFYMDFLVNKIMVGLLPGQLDNLNLEFASHILDNDEITDATITIHASNIPPHLSLNDLVGTALTMMGFASTPPSGVAYAIDRLTLFLSTTMQSLFSQYASQHPELSLNLDLTETVPPITWTATASDMRLTQCVSLAPTLLSPMSDQLNWHADDTLRGDGGVYVRPALGEEARIVSLPPGFTYTGGAFGDNVINSDTVTLTVGDLDVSIELLLGFPDDNINPELTPYLAQSYYYYEDSDGEFMHNFEGYDRAPDGGLPNLNFDLDTCIPTGGTSILPGATQVFLTSIGGACSSAQHDTTLDVSPEGLSGAITLNSSAEAKYSWGEYPIECKATAGFSPGPQSIVLKIDNNTDADVELVVDFELSGEILPADPGTIWHGDGTFSIIIRPNACVANSTLTLFNVWYTDDPNGTGSQTLTLASGTHYISFWIQWSLRAESKNGMGTDPPNNTRVAGTADGTISFRIQQPTE